MLDQEIFKQKKNLLKLKLKCNKQEIKKYGIILKAKLKLKQEYEFTCLYVCDELSRGNSRMDLMAFS